MATTLRMWATSTATSKCKAIRTARGTVPPPTNDQSHTIKDVGPKAFHSSFDDD